LSENDVQLKKKLDVVVFKQKDTKNMSRTNINYY